MAAIQPVRSSRGLRSSLSSLAQPAERKPLSTDWILVSIVGALVIFGLIMSYSTTFYWSVSQEGNPFSLFFKQLIYAGVGLVLFLVLSYLDYGIWHKLALPLMVLAIGLLLAVLFFGTRTFGATRTLFNGSLQPSEPAKIIILLYGAAWLASRRKQVTSITVGLVPFIIIIGTVVGLIIAEPDLSTSIIILIAASAMFFLAGASLIQIVMVGGLAAGLAYLMVGVFQHVSNRISGFKNGFEEVYQIKQALISIGSGGLFGTGIGGSYQKFGLLPAQHTDSVIAVVTEEMGLIGMVIVLILLAALAYRCLVIVQRSDTPFGAFWAIGLTTWLMMQALLNMMANTGLIPLPGVPIPFISYGGSSLISVLAAAGILVSISRGTKRLK
ncbi:MAG TPA: FtsW/RodA/SpoVE family cell cycle protein, partial [Anaerolineae bacterium]